MIQSLVGWLQPEASDQPTDPLSVSLERVRHTARPGSLIIIISDFFSLDEDCNRHLSRLRQHNDVIGCQVMDRAEQMEQQLVSQAEDMKKMNNDLAQANEMMAKAKELRNSAGDKASTMPKHMVDYFKANGIEWDKTGNDYIHNKDEWDVNIGYLKAHVDTLNSQSQMEMIRLQSLMTKRNQAYEETSNQVSKLSKPFDSIIGNMR